MLILITETEVQRESWRHAPVVLDEVIDIRGLHCQTEHAESLVKSTAVALTRLSSCGWQRSRRWVGRKHGARTPAGQSSVGGRQRSNRAIRLEVYIVSDEVGQCSCT